MSALIVSADLRSGEARPTTADDEVWVVSELVVFMQNLISASLHLHARLHIIDLLAYSQRKGTRISGEFERYVENRDLKLLKDRASGGKNRDLT